MMQKRSINKDFLMRIDIEKAEKNYIQRICYQKLNTTLL